MRTMGRGERKEPSFAGGQESGSDFRLSADDRAVPGLGRARAVRGQRRAPTFEPTLEARRERETPAVAAGDTAGEEGMARARRAADQPSARGRKPSRGKGSGGKGSGGGGGSGGRRSGGGRKRRSWFGRLAYWTTVLGLWCLIAVGGVVAYNVTKLPPIDKITVPQRPPNIAILADDGSLLANRGETGGQTVSLKDLPKYLPQAFIAIEDRRFYSHFGIDPIGLSRAFLHLVLSGQISQGGSTLTQQLAKNLFLTQERTLSRKIQEAILALWLERRYSKDQILELYLNRVYFGAGAYGVEAAAHRYFNKSARNVTLAEAAMLGGLVQAPSRLAPNRNPKGAAARAAQVVAAMEAQGFITDKMAKMTLAEPARTRRPAGAGSANYVADWVMDVLDDYVGKIDHDIVVRTTVSPAMQAAAERAVVDEIDQKGAKAKVSQGALVAMAPDGAVKALIGGRNYADSQFNRVVNAHRQPGSSFKPFVYLTALEHGMTPDTLLTDAPINIKGWRPENYTRNKYFGQISMIRAVAMSLNTPVVRLVQQFTPRAVIRTAQRLGINSALQPNVSIALGTSEVTPLEMATAFSAFANGGIGVVPHVIAEVKTADGKAIYRRAPINLGRVVQPEQVAMMNTMLRQTIAWGTGKRAQLPGWEPAGKTGTTQDYKDAWFVGYTPYLTAVVWLGNDDGAPTKRVTGGSLPAEVWSHFMQAAHRGVQPMPLPGIGWRPSGEAPPAETPMAANQAQPQTLLPPRNVPRAAGPSGSDKSFLERLIGG